MSLCFALTSSYTYVRPAVRRIIAWADKFGPVAQNALVEQLFLSYFTQVGSDCNCCGCSVRNTSSRLGNRWCELVCIASKALRLAAGA